MRAVFTRCYRVTAFVLLAAAGAWAAGSARADVVSLTAVQDTMITNLNDKTSSGRGIHACVGRNGQSATCRALFQFDVSPIPAGSTVTDVQFDLWVQPNAQGVSGIFDLHLLLQNWGEGGSVAPQGGCQGANAEQDDATWNYRFYETNTGAGPPWSTPGGHFVLPESASLGVSNSAGIRTWNSLQLAMDVQGWIDSGGATNYGWLLKRQSETGSGNALRFKTRQNSTASERPRLRVTFDPPEISGACCQAGATCSDGNSSDCLALGGIFQGDGTTCATTVCVDSTGACCDPSGSCSVAGEFECQAGGGTYQGDGGDCSAVDCPVLLTPFVDALPRPAVAKPTVGAPGAMASYTIAMREVQQQLHRDMPATTVWGYADDSSGATFPGPTIEARVDQTVKVKFVNDLRDTSAAGNPKPLRTDHYLAVAGTQPPPECHVHGAEDKAKAVVHLHGGHVPAAFDGNPEDNYDPGQSLTFVYPNNQQPGTLWYHDHALGITRLNVYMGLAGFYLIRDTFEAGLGLPSGKYEIPLAIQDRSFNPDGTLDYPADIQDVFFGDSVLVNGKVWPFLEVAQGKYRFRMLNGSGSRTYRMTLDRLDLPGMADLPFVQIGTDGGLIDAPLILNQITLAPAERADVIVDFQGLPVGTEFVLTNDAPAPFPGSPGVGVVPNVMKFVVTAEPGHTTALPTVLRLVKPIHETDSIRTRDFTLQKFGDACGGIWKINDLTWDDIVEYPQLGTTEIWQFINRSNVMHPMHMHLVFFQVLDRVPIGGGAPLPPGAGERGWKDTVQAPPGMITRVIARFEDYTGKFAYHCHILEHEDHEMMRQFWSVEAVESSFDKTHLSWNARPGATGYDIVRGDLGKLRATAGNFAFSRVTQTCLANKTAGRSIGTGPDPQPGEAYFFLIRAIDPGGKATYDTGSSSQIDFRDDEIATSGNDCP